MVTKSGCSEWAQQRTNLEKTLLSLSSLLLLTLILVILFGVAFNGTKKGNISSDGRTGCWSSECVITAGQILSTMDETVDPCTNFYDYACGSYDHKPRQTASVAESSVDSVYLSIKRMLESPSLTETEDLDMVQSFYKSCLEFDGLHRVLKQSAEILLTIMERYGVGNWPVVDTLYEESELSVSDRLSNLALVGVPVAFKVEVVPDARIKGSYILKLTPGGPLETGRTATEIRSDDDLRAYMLFSFLLLGTPNYLRATNAKDEILSVDAYYATVEQDDANKCDSVDIWSPEESLNMLNNLMPEMNWTSLLFMIRKEAGLKKPFSVELHCKSKMRDYLVHLNDLPAKTLDNYLGWRFFESFSKHIGPAFKRHQTNGAGDPPRWKECVKLLEKYASPVLSQGLTAHFKSQEISQKVKKIFQSTRSTSEDSVKQTRWLSSVQKSQIIGKVKEKELVLPFVTKTTGPPRIELDGVSKGNYTSTVIGLRRQRIINEFRNLDPSTQMEERSGPWLLPLTSEDSEPTSSLGIYFDKLQEPYFRLLESDWINYGGLGVYISKEFSKALIHEEMGLSTADHVTLWDVWSSSRNASSCLLHSFYENLGFEIIESEGRLHLQEIFLDVSSLEIAYESAKKGASPSKSYLPGLEAKSDEQLFFISYAQTLCEANRTSAYATSTPMRDRVNSLMSNSPGFHRAFSCSSSATCQIWA